MNVDEEIRSGYSISSQMKRVWAIQIEMVIHLLNVCKRNNLRIWADGGTLHGAVREHGYIPWDDDIDMLMPREDYDKLISISREEFKDPFFFQCAYTDRHYYRGHSQIRYNDTCMILPDDYYQKFHQGIFIDIFVYDAIPDEFDSVWEAKLKRADEISRLLYKSSYSQLLSRQFFQRLFYKLMVGFGKDLKLFQEFESLFRDYSWETCKRTACPCFKRTIFQTATKEINWYRETVLLPFEDIFLPAPIDYDAVLSKQYGADYMTPRQVSSIHGGGIVFDTEKSYKDYLPKLRADDMRRKVVKYWKMLTCVFKRK